MRRLFLLGLFFTTLISCLPDSKAESYLKTEYKTSQAELQDAIMPDGSASISHVFKTQKSPFGNKTTATLVVTILLPENEKLTDEAKRDLYIKAINAVKNHVANLQEHDILKINIKLNNSDTTYSKDIDIASLEKQ